MSKEVTFARPDHTGGRLERLIISVARELALGMRTIEDICETHGITMDDIERMKSVPLFQQTLSDHAGAINATANTKKRLKLKAQYTLEQMLPTLFEIATDVNAPAVAKVKAIELVAKMSGVIGDSDGGGSSGGGSRVNINVAGMMPTGALTVRPDVMDLQVIEARANLVPEIDDEIGDELADLLDTVDDVRERRLRHEALVPGHDHTFDELNAGASPVPGFDMSRVHRRGEGDPFEIRVSLGTTRPVVAPTINPVETVDPLAGLDNEDAE